MLLGRVAACLFVLAARNPIIEAASTNGDVNSGEHDFFKRRLLSNVQKAKAHWTPENIRAALPFDMYLDEHAIGDINAGDLRRRMTSKAEKAKAHWSPESVDAAVPFDMYLDDPKGKHLKHESKHHLRGKGKEHASQPEMSNARLRRKRKNHKTWDDAGAMVTRGSVDDDIETADLSEMVNGIGEVSDGSTELNITDMMLMKESSGTTSDRNPYSDSSSYYSSNRSPYDSSGLSTLISEKVNDSDWPFRGAIQSAVGRIMFTFDGQQNFKCSGTVIKDNTQGRSIVLTAAHCAYNTQLGKFASMAVFIPDQDSTTGYKSDTDCSNDLYGCWMLSFAVVAKGWTTSNFPYNVGYDYGYYVVHDQSSTHWGGYRSNLIGILDQDVVAMDVDFDIQLSNEFTVSFGYADDRDPSFQYCSDNVSTIRGIEDYTNLWLGNCGMHGGASGGSWMIDTTEQGTGTVVSLNSWGYSTKYGIAGPSLQTAGGSQAECLFEIAKTATTPSDGGWTVNC